MKTIYISGEIGWDVMPNDIREQIDSKSKEAIRVIINSPGGYVSDGLEIYNILKAYSGKVEIVIGVMAASIAAYVAMVAPLENRKAFKNSSFMEHEASGGTWGRARDLKIMSDRLEGINNIVAEAFSEGLGVTKEKAREMMSEDNYMTGWEALLENNIISDIIDIEDVDIPQKEEDENDTYIIFETMKAELEKEPDAKIIKTKMYETEEKSMKSEAEKNDIEKAVALLGNKIEPKKQESNAVKPAEENITIEESKMDLTECLEKNPEAKAEHEKLLDSAKAEGIKEARAENETLAKVLKLEGVKISEAAAKTIDGDMSIDEYMEAELMRQKDIRAEIKPSVFGNLVAPQIPGEQDPEQKKETAENSGGLSMEEFDKKLDAKFEAKNKSRRVV